MMTYIAKGHSPVRRLCSLFLMLCLLLSLAPALVTEVSAEYYDDAVQNLVGWGVMSGYPDGTFQPNNPITRAEFVAMINRAYGFTRVGATPFVDVPANAWYANDIGIAYNAGYFSGTSATTASPNDVLTREQALVLLAKNMRLDDAAGEVIGFSDGQSFSTWSQGLANSAIGKGLVGGYSDGSFRPKQSISRGEMAVMLNRALGSLINEAGTYTLGDVYGNVSINHSDTVLKDTTIAGDLYISGGLDREGVSLQNVRVLGEIVVAGSGEAQGGDSITLFNTRAENMKIDNIANQYVSLRAEGNTVINDLSVLSDAYIMDRTASGMGLLNISLDGGTAFTVAGNVENVYNRSDFSTLTVGTGSVENLVVDEAAQSSRLIIDGDAAVRNLSLDTATPITGTGDIDKLNVLTAGSSSAILPDTVEIRPGLTSNIAGQSMTPAMATESSSTPRILASFPKVTNIAASTATAAFKTNKAGTLYWVVSSVANGSVSENILLDPRNVPAVVCSGNIRVTAADREFTANLNKMTAGLPYYLTCMLVDARGDHSAIKVLSFSTVDTSVPGFATGSAAPSLTANWYEDSTAIDRYYAQITVVSTKDSDLYWALYPAGATAPSTTSLLNGTLSGAIASGKERALRNEAVWLNLTGLEESTSYVVYLWLNDADNARSSPVRSITFTTVDGTPPEFQFATPAISNVAVTSLRLRVNLNEACTVYWVAVVAGTDYLINPPSGSGTSAVEYQTRQIKSGVNAFKSGRVNVRPDTDTQINITGLGRETTYDIYYIAQDAAGNFSLYPDARYNKLTQRTLDNTPPTVTQEFTHEDNGSTPAAPAPESDSGVRIIFSEDVKWLDGDDDTTLMTFREGTSTQPEILERKEKFLRSIMSLWVYSNELRREIEVTPRSSATSADDPNWTIDWQSAVISQPQDSNNVIVFFPGSSAPTPALNLKSGSTYHFEFDRIEDTAAQGNIMRGTPFRLPDFTVVAAKINLSKAEDEYRINQTQKISRDDSGAPIRDVTGEPRYVAAEEADVRVDSAFFLYPSSLKVDNSVIWDMIIWADRTCEIQLYRLDDTGWTLLNDTPQPISVPTTTAYNGLSLRRDFIGIEDSFARLAELEEGRNYEYAIHLTRLGQDGEGSSRSTDPEGWRGEIHFGVSVISGTTTNLNNFYSSNLMQRYSTFTTQVGDGRLLDIGTPHPFTDSRILMTKSFADKSIPSFQAGFPSLVDLADRSARISLRTDASARLFYVIMPGMNSSVVNRTHSTVATYPDPLADGVDTETVIVDDASRDVFIDEVRDAAAANATWYIGSTTNRPGKSWVTDASPSTIPTNGAKMGYLDLVPGITDYLSVSGLNANSRYFVYFVLQGDGEASDPYVYTFRTPSASAPILRADGFDTTATVQLYYPETRTTVKWVLVNSNLLDQLGTRFFGSDGFNTLFSGEEIVDEQAKASGRYGSFWRSQYESYTITEAITEPVLDGNRVLGSVFDLFATEAAKSEVSRNLDSAPYGNVIVEVGSFELTNATATSPATRTINLNEKNLIKGTQYTLLARATASNSEDSSGQGFAGCAPMQIPEKQTPQLDPGQELTVTLTTDTYSNDDGTISGSITLMFDQALYVMTGGKLIPIDRAAPDAADTDRISIADTRLSENLDPDTIKVRTNGEAGTAVSTIVLDLDHTRGGTFRFGGQDYQISSVDRYTTNIPVSLILNYSGELFTVQVTDWNHSDERRASRDPEERADYGTVKYEKTIQLRTSTIDVESVSIYNSKTNSTASTITISQNETIQLTALYQPPNATNATVRWINSDTAEDYISLGSTAGETIELTGKAATRRGVTVTAYCGGKQATITVNVNAVILPSTIRFQDSSTLNLVQGGDAEIVSYYLEPSNATDRDIEYWWYRQSGSNQIDEDRFPPTVRVLSDGSLEIRATAQVSGGLYNLKLMSKADNEVYALKTVKVIEATQENP